MTTGANPIRRRGSRWLEISEIERATEVCDDVVAALDRLYPARSSAPGDATAGEKPWKVHVICNACGNEAVQEVSPVIETTTPTPSVSGAMVKQITNELDFLVAHMGHRRGYASWEYKEAQIRRTNILAALSSPTARPEPEGE